MLTNAQLQSIIDFYERTLAYQEAHPPSSPPAAPDYGGDTAAPSAAVQAIIDYYVNLLIIQYHNKPKAMAAIAAVAKEIIANGILLAIENGYSLGGYGYLTYDSGAAFDSGAVYDQTPDVSAAVGAQLDILGKYAGTDRFYSESELIDFFGLTSYSEFDPDALPHFGFLTYADYDTADSHNGTLTYDDIISVANSLVDEYFRTIILIKIFQNYSNHSHSSIENALFSFFNGAIRPESFGNMVMFYFIASTVTPVMRAVLDKKILPKPMGVRSIIVSDATGNIFGMTDYSDYQSPYSFGFCDYSNYDSLAGTEITYSQISQG